MNFISVVLYLWLSDSFERTHLSVKFYPLPSEQIPACEPPNSPPQISPSNNRNWPLLPFSIPVCSVSSPDFITWQICTDPSLPPLPPPITFPLDATRVPWFTQKHSRLSLQFERKEKKKRKRKRSKGRRILKPTNPEELAQPQTKRPRPSPPSLPKPHQTARSHL